MATWKWYACDLKSGVRISELPLKPSGAITSLLCQDGAGSFTLPIYDPATPEDWWLSVQPYRTCIVGELNDVVVWSGWVKGYTAGSDDNGSTVEVACSTMEGYLQERYVDVDLTVSPADQNLVVAALVDAANSNGVNFIIDAPASGVYLDSAKYYRHADQQIYAMITELSDLDGGPEWTVTSAWDAESDLRTIKHTLHVRTPHIGSVVARPFHRFIYPSGNIKSWTLDTGGPYANIVVAGGNGDGASRIMSTSGIAQDATAYAVYGYPMFESRLSTQAGTQAGVDSAALGELAAKRQFTTVLSLTIDANAIDVSNLWGKGDTAYVQIDAPNLSQQYSDVWRIIGWDVDSDTDTITPHLIEYTT